MNSYERIYKIVTEVRGGPMRQRSKKDLKQIPHQRDMRGQAKAFGTPPHKKADAEEGTPQDVRISIAKAKAALKIPTLTGMQRAKIQAYYNRLTNKKTGETASIPQNENGGQRERKRDSLGRRRPLHPWTPEEEKMFPTAAQVSKMTRGMSKKQVTAFNRAMTTKKKSGEWRSPERSTKIAKRIADSIIQEIAPPGWGHTKAEKEKTKPWKPKSKIGGSIQAMKRAQERGDIPEKYNIFALAWSMKNKGDKPHYKPGVRNVKKKKYRGEK